MKKDLLRSIPTIRMKIYHQANLDIFQFAFELTLLLLNFSLLVSQISIHWRI